MTKQNKKGLGALAWIIIILIILAIGGIVAWLFLSGDGSSILGSMGGSSIPQPPALPSG